MTRLGVGLRAELVLGRDLTDTFCVNLICSGGANPPLISTLLRCSICFSLCLFNSSSLFCKVSKYVKFWHSLHTSINSLYFAIAAEKLFSLLNFPASFIEISKFEGKSLLNFNTFLINNSSFSFADV